VGCRRRSAARARGRVEVVEEAESPAGTRRCRLLLGRSNRWRPVDGLGVGCCCSRPRGPTTRAPELMGRVNKFDEFYRNLSKFNGCPVEFQNL
jgi:hypothetical protein